MESAISLRYCPFPYISKGFQGAGSIGFHLRLNHGAPQFSATRNPVTRSIGHANCMLRRFSEPSQNEGRGSKILRGVTGASLVLACVLGLFSFKMNPKLITAHALSSSSDHNSPMSGFDPFKVEDKGRDVLQSLLKIMKDAEDETYQNEIIPSRFSKLGPSENEVNTLKCIAIGQRKSEKGVQALKTLHEQYMKCKNSFPEAEQYLGLALVEVFLLLQENLEEARKILDEQIDRKLDYESQIFSRKKANKKCDELRQLYNDSEFGPTKVVIPKWILYKAILHTTLEDNETGNWGRGNKEALEWRKAFIKIF